MVPQVSKDNVTVVRDTNHGKPYQLEEDFGLFTGLRGSGSSFGIVTEFLYKMYSRPETRPVLVPIFIENPTDLRLLEKATMGDKYHISWFPGYSFREVPLSFGTLVS